MYTHSKQLTENQLDLENKMKVNRVRLKRILREALEGIDPATGDFPYVEQAQVEDVLLDGLRTAFSCFNGTPCRYI